MMARRAFGAAACGSMLLVLLLAASAAGQEAKGGGEDKPKAPATAASGKPAGAARSSNIIPSAGSVKLTNGVGDVLATGAAEAQRRVQQCSTQRCTPIAAQRGAVARALLPRTPLQAPASAALHPVRPAPRSSGAAAQAAAARRAAVERRPPACSSAPAPCIHLLPPAAPGPCKADAPAFCKGVSAGDGRLAGCLMKRVQLERKGNVAGRGVSDGCKEELAAFKLDRNKHINKDPAMGEHAI